MHFHKPSTARAAASRLPAQDLRCKAEVVVCDTPSLSLEVVKEMTPEDTQLLFHELRVHQIELEMQNEELHRAHAALQEERARYFELYDLAPVSYCTLDEQGLILEANLTAAHLLGVTRSAMVNQPVTRFIFHDDQDIYYLHHKRHVISDEPRSCELRMVKNDGTVFWVQLAVTTLQHPLNKVLHRVVLTNMTERKHLQEARDEALDCLEKIAEHVPGVVYQYLLRADGSTCFPFASDNINAIYRVSPAQVREDASLVFERIHPDDHAAVTASILASAQNLTVWRHEYRVKFDDGTVRWLQGNALPQQQPEGATLWHGFITDITDRKQVEESLRDHARQLQALSRHVLEAQETERRRLAVELHDELGQSLTAIKINLQTHERFKEQVPGDLFAENIRIVEDALQQVRRLSLALRPSMLDDLGLVPALRWIAEQTAARGGFAVKVDSFIPSVRLATEIETACFRIVQEALTNIVRHAHATQVDIELRQEGDFMVLCVRDDGCGFDIIAMRERALAGGSIGVLGMQERAVLIGGLLEMQSTPGQGSAMQLRCPLRLSGVSA